MKSRKNFFKNLNIIETLKNKRKKKKEEEFTFKEVLGIMALVCIISVFSTYMIINRKNYTSNGTLYSELLKDDNVKEFLDVYATITKNYYQEVDASDVVSKGISSMMEYLGDKYTVYLDSEEADDLTSSLSGTYQGIGVEMSVAESGVIKSILDDSPAEKAGLMVDDKIIKVNGEDVSNLKTEDISSLIKSSTDNIAHLTVLRNEETLEIDVEIGSVNTPDASYQIFEKNNKKIGYMYLSKFTETLPTQVKNTLNKLEEENIDSLIIDVRSDGGGYLSSAEEIISMFLEKGKKMYSLKDKEEVVTDYFDETEEKREYPIAILIDGGSASASEILTSALVDSYGAITIGSTSYGKGKVQQAKNLQDGSILKYTTSYWLRPNGECVDGNGITPDYEVELEFETDENGVVTSVTDTVFNKAIEILSSN